MQTRLPMLALVAATLSIAGCGGSSGTSASTSGQAGSTSDGSGSALSTAQLVSNADATCARVDARLAAAGSTANSQKELASVAPARAKLEQEALAELEKLAPPAPMKDEWQQLITARRAFAEELANLGRASAAGNSAAMLAAGKSGASAEQAMVAAARNLGLTDCAKAD
jgi:hypothetical protein